MKRKKASKSSNKNSKRKKTINANYAASSPSNANYDEEPASDEKDASPRNSIKEPRLPLTSPDEMGNPVNSDTATSEASSKQPVYTRVKVKLKSLKPLQPSITSIDREKNQEEALLPASDTSMEKKEESNYSDGRISDLQPSRSGKSPRKAGSIKIISSKGAIPSKIGLPEERTERDFKLYRRRDHSAPRVDPRYNQNELKSSLVVIKKIMRMEAAEPFNAPVDPIALGIPDYFEVIETPMDFGTICEDLQKGRKYMNSKDVFKDVQFIWGNCYKYNNKGDYILDLMKRVKRNFMKYWTAAGLSTDLSEQNKGTHAESSIKEESKAKSTKSKRKRFGIDLHKSDCLCAVCVVRRRRREREEQPELTDKQTETSDDKTQDFIEEKTIPKLDTPSERSSSSVDEIHERDDALERMEEGEKEEILETKREASETVHEDESSGHPPDEDVHTVHDDGGDAHDFSPAKEGILPSPGEDLGQGKDMGREKVAEKSVYESPSRVENIAVVEICRALFGRDSSSVWRGPHSLTPRQPVPRHTPIHAAVSSFFER